MSTELIPIIALAIMFIAATVLPVNMGALGFVAAFIGSPKINLLPITGAALRDFGALGGAAGAAELGIRPEQLSIGGDSGVGATGTVALVEYLGSEIFIHVAMPAGDVLRVKSTPAAPPRIGEPLRVSFDPATAHYFDAQGMRLAS